MMVAMEMFNARSEAVEGKKVASGGADGDDFNSWIWS